MNWSTHYWYGSQTVAHPSACIMSKEKANTLNKTSSNSLVETTAWSVVWLKYCNLQHLVAFVLIFNATAIHLCDWVASNWVYSVLVIVLKVWCKILGESQPLLLLLLFIIKKVTIQATPSRWQFNCQSAKTVPVFCQPYDWRNRWNLVSHWNVGSEEAALVFGGRLFHARAAATENAQSPKDDRRVNGISHHQHVNTTDGDTGCQMCRCGAVPCTQWYARTQNRNWIRSGTCRQWKLLKQWSRVLWHPTRVDESSGGI